MPLHLEPATAEDAPALSALHTAVAEHLTHTHGRGPWSSKTSERGILYALRTSRVFVAREGAEIVATLHLTTKKPWAIDTSYFSSCRRPLYLISMAVAPARQRLGYGRQCLVEAARLAREWPADAIRLDAFDAEAGAGPFYARCGGSEVGRVRYRETPLVYYEFLLAGVDFGVEPEPERKARKGGRATAGTSSPR
ncbi:MAG TPA: GNAT family N-acetyltransferase [Thermoanaerobaculia bacterium]|nr:GNAT family N-acetyltransferase [Thermoanaerobaculia bacterium]